jgi:aconitate hydratase
MSGPKRPQDRVRVCDVRNEFIAGLTKPITFKSYGLKADHVGKTVPICIDGREYTLRHGSVVIAAITSCTNTSNPSVMLGAGLCLFTE